MTYIVRITPANELLPRLNARIDNWLDAMLQKWSTMAEVSCLATVDVIDSE